MKPVTLCLLIKEDQILLAKKKRGFGIGRLNGIGGKVEDGESIEEAASRELREEIGVKIKLTQLEKAGNIKFYFKDRPEWNQHMHIFLVKNWEGLPKESEEMLPKWYHNKKIPFNSMWADDQHWLPVVLSGKRVEGEFYFTNEGATIDSFKIKEV